jgi:ribosomal protein S18 acetylase RimI-like enzyme
MGRQAARRPHSKSKMPAAASPVRSKRRRIGAAAAAAAAASSSSSSSSDDDDEFDPDTQDGIFFAALREFGAKVGACDPPAPRPQQQPKAKQQRQQQQQQQQQDPPGRRPRRNRKAPDAWWDATKHGSRRPSPAASPNVGPATPPGAPPAKRKSVRRSLATGRMSQPRQSTAASPAPPAVAALTRKLELSAGELGLTLRPATLADVNNITQAHTRFEMEMAAWSPDAEPHLADADGIRGIIEDEGGERILLLTREISRSQCDLLGFVYSFDEEVQQTTYSGVSAYIAQVWLASSERGQGLGELLLCAAMASALSRGVAASHLFLCERNTGARRLYEKSGYAVDGDSGDPVHNLVLVNPAVEPDSIDEMLATRQAKQQALSRTGSRSRGGGRRGAAPAKKAGAASSGDTAVRTTSRAARVQPAKAAAAAASSTNATCSSCNLRFYTASGNPECIDCRSKEAEGEEEEEEETNAVCRKCQLSFFTASGKQECLDCRAVEADEDKEDEEDDEGEGEETTADSSLAVSPDVSPAADQLELQQKQQHKQQRGKQRGKQRKALADVTGCNLHAVAAQMMA